MLYSDNLHIGKDGITLTDKEGKVLSYGDAFYKIARRVASWLEDFNLFIIHLASLHIPFWSLRKVVFQISGIRIGKGSTIHMGCKFFEPKNIIIGEDTIIGDNAFLDGRTKLKIGSHVDIASGVMIYNSEHDINDPTFKATKGEVEIADYVFIGPRVIILPGVMIEEGAIVAAGAVVTKNVSSYEVMGGVPAVKIGVRGVKNLKYHLGRARLFQ